MLRKSTTNAIFALRILKEKYREGQKELYCVLVYLENAHDRVPREEFFLYEVLYEEVRSGREVR